MARIWSAPVLFPVALFTGILCVYLLSGSSDLLHNGDTDLRYQTTAAMVDHHRLWIDHPMWRDSRVSSGVGGHLYAFYAPGQAVLMVPLYIIGKVAAHRLDLPYDITTLYAARSLDLFLGALLALVVYFFGLSLRYSKPVSLALSLIFAFATVAWPDAQSALEQTPVDLFLLLAAFAMWKYGTQANHRRWFIGLAGCWTGAAVCTRYDAAMFLPALALFVLWIRLREGNFRAGVRDAAMYVATCVPWVFLLAAWNFARFGSVFSTGLTEQTFGGAFLTGFLGLTVSPGKGLLWYLPILLLLPWAAPQFARKRPVAAVLFAILVAMPLVFYSNVLFWHGDPSWGPRYLYTAIPYLTLPLGELLMRWKSRPVAVRLVVSAVILGSYGLQLAAVSVTPWRFWYRLEVMQQRGVDARGWRGQPFHWGASYYHYYWNVEQSPLLIQLDNVYQVARLQLGASQYRFTSRPNPYVSNPADNYPINTFLFWWADERHPILGPHAREALALSLTLLACLSFGLVSAHLGPLRGTRRRRLHDAASPASSA